MKLYHGSPFLFDTIDLSLSKDKRDFEKGFYTTTFENQARQWAESICLQYDKGICYLYEYEFEIDDELDIKTFEDYSMDWLDMIFVNRIKGDTQHRFDVVIGPVADDKIRRTLNLFLKGQDSAQHTLEKLKYNKPNNQVSFHTDKALTKLLFVRRTEWKISA
ncbi:MAG: DUF3990 domain-containing protein [Spirochaetaceae bacterium]|jgi:hypothetical protein|nr:DUF3990 domain-containing protein [Spirochaetaceae bacterium]